MSPLFHWEINLGVFLLMGMEQRMSAVIMSWSLIVLSPGAVSRLVTVSGLFVMTRSSVELPRVGTVTICSSEKSDIISVSFLQDSGWVALGLLERVVQSMSLRLKSPPRYMGVFGGQFSQTFVTLCLRASIVEVGEFGGL